MRYASLSFQHDGSKPPTSRTAVVLMYCTRTGYQVALEGSCLPSASTYPSGAQLRRLSPMRMVKEVRWAANVPANCLSRHSLAILPTRTFRSGYARTTAAVRMYLEATEERKLTHFLLYRSPSLAYLSAMSGCSSACCSMYSMISTPCEGRSNQHLSHLRGAARAQAGLEATAVVSTQQSVQQSSLQSFVDVPVEADALSFASVRCFCLKSPSPMQLLRVLSPG